MKAQQAPLKVLALGNLVSSLKEKSVAIKKEL